MAQCIVFLILFLLPYSLHGSHAESKSAAELGYPEVTNELYFLMEAKTFTEDQAKKLKRFLLIKKRNCEATFKPLPHKSILMHAAAHNPDALRVILSCMPHIDRQDENGDTAMHYAVKKGALAACRLLYVHSAQSDIPNNAGITARQLVDNLFEQYSKAFAQNTIPHSLECTEYIPCSTHQFAWSEIKEKKEFFSYLKIPASSIKPLEKVNYILGYDRPTFSEFDIR